MRSIVTRPVSNGPEDGERNARLVALLATGLERFICHSPGEDSLAKPVDYSPNLSPTTNTNGGNPTEQP
jgi:hypothetical protein